MRIMGKRIVGFSFGVGVATTVLAMLVPKVSDTIVNFVADLRNKISGKEKTN